MYSVAPWFEGQDNLPWQFGELFGDMVNQHIIPNVKKNLQTLLDRVLAANGESFELHYYYPKLLDVQAKKYRFGEKLWGHLYPDLPYDPEAFDADTMVYTIGITGHRDWLIQIQVCSGEIEEFHVRDVWSGKDSDYVASNQYVKRPSFKFYQDRGWSLEFQEQLHMTALGGVYGDSRDKGYVISATGSVIVNTSSYIHYYASINNFFSMLSSWVTQIRGDED